MTCRTLRVFFCFLVTAVSVTFSFVLKESLTRYSFIRIRGRTSSSSRIRRSHGSSEEEAPAQEEAFVGGWHVKTDAGTYSAHFLEDNGLEITQDSEGRVTARPFDLVMEEEPPTTPIDGSLTVTSTQRAVSSASKPDPTSIDGITQPSLSNRKKQPSASKDRPQITEHPAQPVPHTGFNVVLTHATADFDSLASAVGLAKLWSSSKHNNSTTTTTDTFGMEKDFDSASNVPTFVVLPRGAHPSVQRFLSLHKHLFPIRSLKSLPTDLSGLNRLALVDAQRRDRLGPAEHLLSFANRVTVVDHHVDQDSDISATDYVVDQVGSVSTLIVERLQEASTDIELTEAEATLLALGVHADTGSLCFDSTTPRDAQALAWCLHQGASQTAIAEHAQNPLSPEQQGVLTQALINANTTVQHGVTISTVLLSADGFINGLAQVTQDAMELSSSDIFLLGLVYQAQPGGGRRGRGSKAKARSSKSSRGLLTSRFLTKDKESAKKPGSADSAESTHIQYTEAWQGGDEALKRKRLRLIFDRRDIDGSGYLEHEELAAALASSGVITSDESILQLMQTMDKDDDGRIDFEEFVEFWKAAEKQEAEEQERNHGRPATMIIIGRVKASVSSKAVKLNNLLERFGGGGHPKAASATLRLSEEVEADTVMQQLVDELVETSLHEQPLVGDFMTAPVLSVKTDMTEKQVEDLFRRYDVRALPVVDDNNEVIGLVTYKEVAAAKQRLFNKEQKRLRRDREAAERGEKIPAFNDSKAAQERKRGSTVKGWMLQHVQLVETSTTMAEVEAKLLEMDIGCLPVVADGTKQLVGMVTRTDLLRQHRYYPSLHYHNKGFADSIAARKPIIALRKKLKKFDDLDA